MSGTSKVVIGTRGSELALWQSRWVEKQLLKLQPSLRIEIRTIKTKGDKILDSALSKIGDKGLFTKEIEHALLDGSVDIAVHSLKDIPTKVEEGLTISAICEREDVRDVFVAHGNKNYSTLADIPHGGTIATGSLRRRCQLLRIRPDLTIVEIRGNLGTRIEKLNASDWDGMLLAKAGITRLGRTELIAEILSPAQILPAVGQGALAIETRESDADVRALIKPLDHLPTRQAVLGERALLRRLEGGCQVPIGAYARIENDKYKMDAMIGSLDGKRSVRSSIEGRPNDAEKLGLELAEQLLSAGGEAILNEIRELNV
ncbi:MAG TPA: hydroxymethylbilane synthase [Bacteroidota bacterium]